LRDLRLEALEPAAAAGSSVRPAELLLLLLLLLLPPPLLLLPAVVVVPRLVLPTLPLLPLLRRADTTPTTPPIPNPTCKATISHVKEKVPLCKTDASSLHFLSNVSTLLLAGIELWAQMLQVELTL
jgi:hypothetical protein